jgi:hypothetical protein
MVVALRGSDTLYDYHRLWGGDLVRRGELAAAAAQYEQANALSGGGPARFFQLADLYDRLGRAEDARRALVAGLARAPDDERGRRVLARLGYSSGGVGK